jgi:oligopeptide/dipeptide ABC transporter ATP-binding protein
LERYPHQFSGGQRQRLMIAGALACSPSLVIADEPTTALDVTLQAQILDLLRELQSSLGMSVILISHDMGVIAEFAQRVVVMYAGRVVETAPVKELFRKPVHPYTEGLLAAIPKLDVDVPRLPTIRGSIPDPAQTIEGCRYGPRCPVAIDKCLIEAPALLPVGPSHFARCPPRVGAP